MGASAFKGKPGKNEFGKKLQSISSDAQNDSEKIESNPKLSKNLSDLAQSLGGISGGKYGTFRQPLGGRTTVTICI